jgi:hypothetical protein
VGQLVLAGEELSFEPPEVPESELVDESEPEPDEVESDPDPDVLFELDAPEPDDDRLSFL